MGSEAAQAIFDICEEFHRDYIVKDVQPPVGASDSWSAWLAKKWSSSTGPMIYGTKRMNELASDLHGAKIGAKVYAQEIAKIQNELKDAIADASGINFGDGSKVTWKFDAKGRPSYKDIAYSLGFDPEIYEAHKDLLAENTSEPVRRFLLKESKK